MTNTSPRVFSLEDQNLLSHIDFPSPQLIRSLCVLQQSK